MKKIYLYFIPTILFISCYGINEKTSEIATLNTDYLSADAWSQIKKEHSVKDITNLKYIEILKEFENKPFTNEVLYFNENPEEFIAVSTDHYSIRYVYNSKISDAVLNGLSSNLSDKEKKRIHKRIQTLLMRYQSEEGRLESLKIIEELN